MTPPVDWLLRTRQVVRYVDQWRINESQKDDHSAPKDGALCDEDKPALPPPLTQELYEIVRDTAAETENHPGEETWPPKWGGPSKSWSTFVNPNLRDMVEDKKLEAKLADYKRERSEQAGKKKKDNRKNLATQLEEPAGEVDQVRQDDHQRDVDPHPTDTLSKNLESANYQANIAAQKLNEDALREKCDAQERKIIRIEGHLKGILIQNKNLNDWNSDLLGRNSDLRGRNSDLRGRNSDLLDQNLDLLDQFHAMGLVDREWPDPRQREGEEVQQGGDKSMMSTSSSRGEDHAPILNSSPVWDSGRQAESKLKSDHVNSEGDKDLRWEFGLDHGGGRRGKEEQGRTQEEVQPEQWTFRNHAKYAFARLQEKRQMEQKALEEKRRARMNK